MESVSVENPAAVAATAAASAASAAVPATPATHTSFAPAIDFIGGVAGKN